MNGLAGPTIMSAGPFLSTTWFATDQRATATAVASLFAHLGGAASFVIGPLIVPSPNDTETGVLEAPLPDSTIRSRIQLVMYIGTSRNLPEGREGLITPRFDITSTPPRDTNTIRRGVFKNLTLKPKKAEIIIFITTPLKNRLRVLCLSDSEN